MQTHVRARTIILTLGPSFGLTQPAEPEILKETLSIHQVRRGNMPLRHMASGSVSSLNPARASVTLPYAAADSIRVGQKASVQIKPPQTMTAKVARIDAKPSGESVIELEVADGLPSEVALGTRLGALIEVGELPDVIFFERPGDARPNSEAIIFLIEADGEHAKRVAVRYGRQSGPMMEIVSGLSPGDRVIVTDMSKWASYARVRLK